MTYPERPLLHLLTRTSLVGQIIVGLIAGLLLASFFPAAALKVGFIGKVFVSALKAVAPVLVFVLVMASIANHKQGQQTHIRPILLLYLVGTFSAAVVAVIASFAFPSSLVLASHPGEMSPPGGIAEVLQSLLLSVVDNPVNALISANFIGILAWAKRLGLHEDTYSVSIPLGATINMAGAAITITVLTLAAVHTLGIAVDVPTAILLSVVASICACGASGVAGGSLLLIPLACSLFGIPSEVAMQVVAVGFIIAILQDSAETALNSSTDVLFTAAACEAEERKASAA